MAIRALTISATVRSFESKSGPAKGTNNGCPQHRRRWVTDPPEGVCDLNREAPTGRCLGHVIFILLHNFNYLERLKSYAKSSPLKGLMTKRPLIGSGYPMPSSRRG